MFAAIDVETANADMASICQIGIARFDQDGVTDEWSTLVNPLELFDSINMSIHGIGPDHVGNAPTFPDAFEEIRPRIASTVCVCHTHFDRISFYRAFAKHGIERPDLIWLDSARVARRTWPDIARKGYGLANICNRLGYEFRHHDALEDAKAAGHILLSAIKETGCSLEDWMQRVSRPISPSHTGPVKCKGNQDGILFGEVCVFTGSLELPRREVANLAAEAGIEVAGNISKRVTLVVVGDQDLTKLAGHNKSLKHRKAEELQANGHPVRIIQESDFKSLVDY